MRRLPLAGAPSRCPEPPVWENGTDRPFALGQHDPREEARGAVVGGERRGLRKTPGVYAPARSQFKAAIRGSAAKAPRGNSSACRGKSHRACTPEALRRIRQV